MTIVLLLTMSAVLLGVGAIVVTVRRRRQPAELRGDWWAAFDREFRAYAHQTASVHPPSEHSHHPPRGFAGD